MSAVIEQASAGVAAASRAPAHRILSAGEALSCARTLAREFARDAVMHDQQRRLPHAEIERFSASGLQAGG